MRGNISNASSRDALRIRRELLTRSSISRLVRARARAKSCLPMKLRSPAGISLKEELRARERSDFWNNNKVPTRLDIQGNRFRRYPIWRARRETRSRYIYFCVPVFPEFAPSAIKLDHSQTRSRFPG